MSSFSDITTIEYLYNEEEISGKSYLFCVENDIDTLQDLRRFIAESFVCGNIPDDLLVFSNIEQSENSQAEKENAHNVTVEESPSIDEYQRLFEVAVQNCSVRTKNCLGRVQIDYLYPSNSFFNFLLEPGLSIRIKQVKNAGSKTLDEVRGIAEYIRSNIGSEVIPLSTQEDNTPSELDEKDEAQVSELWPILVGLKQNLSVRCCNIIDKLINEQNNSLIKLYNYFNSTNFSCKNIKGIGRKSGEELLSFRNEFLSIVNDCIHNDGENIADLVKTAKLQTILCLNNTDVVLVNNLSGTLNRTPLFRMIDCVINQDERSSIIISKCTRVYNGVTVNIDMACDVLELTRERVRQLRNKLFEELIEKISTWSQHFDFSYYTQYCTASWDKGNIFREEGVDFSDDFIDIVSSILFSDNYTLVGDKQECMMSFYDRKEALFIVPNNFADVFDFEKLLADINQRVTSKIFDDYSLDMNHHILDYFKDAIRFDLVDDIMEYIRLMLFEKFQLVVNEGCVLFNKNASKTIPEYIEEILEANGDVMSIDAIYEQFEKLYPGMTKSKTALRGSILRSDRIVPISRSSNYALREWEAKGIKTGSIRDIVYEYLLGFTTPQLLDKIEEYVKQHRPNTDANSIYNNLILDSRGIFTLLSRSELRYVAIAAHDYGDEFEDIRDVNNSYQRRSFQESIDLLYKFVLNNGRFPFHTSSDFEEERIARFLYNTRLRRSKNQLTDEEITILCDFEATHIAREISRDQYNWRLRCNELENYILENCKYPSYRGDSSLYTWMNKQKNNLLQNNLSEDDAKRFSNILNLL